jgi:hypothetical protein
MTTLRPTIGGLVLIPAWFILNITLFRASWRSYRKAQLPMHGNRLLFWAMSLFWPHAEGLADPTDYAHDLAQLSEDEIRLVMRENALALSQRRPA